MKKLAFAFVIVATLVVALISTSFVYAQGTTPPAPQTPGTGNGYGRGGGMMGGRFANGGQGLASNPGILHDEMISVFAQKLGISVDDLNARLANGETMAQIASSEGLTVEQFTALMQEARAQAIDQAVQDGTLTQSQADWMKTRGAGMFGGGLGAGRGMGQGNAGNCPYYTQTNS